MLRIIAGEKRGMQLIAPAGMDTRPTQAKVRESLFNMLQSEVAGCRVLDLFAGSGALALESLSRGASEAVLCDMDRRAVEVIRKNVEKLRMGDQCQIICSEWSASLKRLSGEPFDLVFLDPPYRMDIFPQCCALLADLGLLAPGALIVLEHTTGRYSAPDDRFSLWKQRDYGETEIHIVCYEESE